MKESLGWSNMAYLRCTNPDGLRRVQSLGIDRLSATLSINVISVVDQPLHDDRGSSVDAIGTPGKIQLNRPAWQQMLLKQQEVRPLVIQ